MVHSRIILYGTGLSNTDRLSIEKYLSEKYYLAVTEVNDLKNQNIPRGFILSQNYPNPFNPTTTIKYEIPKANFVTIKVFNILGKEVSTLVNESKPVGNYSVQFNGSNLSSGVYFYRMLAGNSVDIKKLILLK